MHVFNLMINKCFNPSRVTTRKRCRMMSLFFVYGMNIILVFEMYYHTIIIQDMPLYISCLTYDSCCF